MSELVRLIAAQVCLHACMSGMRMAAPLLALHQGYSPVAVGVLLALFSVTQVFLALPAGRYADRRGLQRPLQWSVAAALSGATAAVLWPGFAVLCASALLCGGASGAASIALQRHVGRMAQGATELKRVFSWLAIGPAISNFIGPAGAGLMIDYAGTYAADTNGFRAAFALMAALPLLTWWLARGIGAVSVAGAQAAEAVGSPWELLREPLMRRLMLVNWLLASCWDVHTFVVPVLGHAQGVSASAIGLILGSFALAAMLVRVLIPAFAAHLREHVVLTVAMLSAGVLLVLYPLAPSVWWMAVCSVLLGWVLGMVQPMVMSMLHQITPAHRQGEALAFRVMVINASSVAMPMLFGAAGAVVGVATVFWVMGGAVSAGARWAWALAPATAPADHKP